MTPTETKKCLQIIGGLEVFQGQFNTGHRSLLETAFRDLPIDQVTVAIMQHSVEARGSDGRFDPVRLIEMCKAPPPPVTSAAEAAAREGSWFDVHRRNNPKLADKSDAEVALRVHWVWWRSCPQTETWRAKLLKSCSERLGESGMSAEESSAWSQTIFEDEAQFRSRLLEIRGFLPVFERAGA